MDENLPKGFEAALKDHLAHNLSRISSFKVADKKHWVKRKEKLSLRFRLQKGDAAESLEAERRALHAFAKFDLPAPRIVAEGEDYFVISDAGEDIRHFLPRHESDAQLRQKVFVEAGQTLARFHAAGFCHGRPAIRDFCWKDGRISLIDFERYDPKKNTSKRCRNDLLVFAHSAFVANRGGFPELKLAVDAYRDCGQQATWENAKAFCRQMRWVDWVTKPIQWRGEGRAKEFKAIPLVFDLFAG